MNFSESLRKNSDFRDAYQVGKSFANKYLVMYVKQNESAKNRIGISVSKKVGNSVVRHRLKRLVKEGYRLQEDRFLNGFDIVIIVRKTALNKSFTEIKKAISHLGHLHNIID